MRLVCSQLSDAAVAPFNNIPAISILGSDCARRATWSRCRFGGGDSRSSWDRESVIQHRLESEQIRVAMCVGWICTRSSDHHCIPSHLCTSIAIYRRIRTSEHFVVLANDCSDWAIRRRMLFSRTSVRSNLGKIRKLRLAARNDVAVRTHPSWSLPKYCRLLDSRAGLGHSENQDSVGYRLLRPTRCLQRRDSHLWTHTCPIVSE